MKNQAWWALLAAGLVLVFASPAWAEYRAYELEVIDLFDCRLNKRERCLRSVVRSSLAPDFYARTHGGSDRIAVVMLATWMCWGDTSGYQDVCPRPAPRNAKFGVGDEIQVRLEKHITDGWRGKIEVAYYQRSVSSNVYGVRFVERQGVYARYFEKDIAAPRGAAPQSEPPQ